MWINLNMDKWVKWTPINRVYMGLSFYQVPIYGG